ACGLGARGLFRMFDDAHLSAQAQLACVVAVLVALAWDQQRVTRMDRVTETDAAGVADGFDADVVAFRNRAEPLPLVHLVLSGWLGIRAALAARLGSRRGLRIRRGRLLRVRLARAIIARLGRLGRLLAGHRFAGDHEFLAR